MLQWRAFAEPVTYICMWTYSICSYVIEIQDLDKMIKVEPQLSEPHSSKCLIVWNEFMLVYKVACVYVVSNCYKFTGSTSVMVLKWSKSVLLYIKANSATYVREYQLFQWSGNFKCTALKDQWKVYFLLHLLLKINVL